MNPSPISPLAPSSHRPADNDPFVLLNGQPMLKIAHHDRMPPFLMSIVSDADLWMYVSSTGGLTAGRIDESRCLFPYVTVDHLHRAAGQTGPVTVLRVHRPGQSPLIWQPLIGLAPADHITRNLYKSPLGHRVVFEEVHADLRLTFRYGWSACDAFGFVRQCELINDDPQSPAHIELLDGLLNLMPACVDPGTMQWASCLVDAYKHSEIDPDTSMGIFAVSSILTDKVEPAEAMRATIVHHTGLDHPAVTLNENHLDLFRAGRPVTAQHLVTGSSGAYLLHSHITINTGQSRSWRIIADVDAAQADVASRRKLIRQAADFDQRVDRALADAAANLTQIVAAADGRQATADLITNAHHMANVLFNVMRGGVIADNGRIPLADFADFVHTRNKPVASRRASLLSQLPPSLDHAVFLDELRRAGDADLLRLGYEYLPIFFSRRHGDPSRPWNRFAIHIKGPDGKRLLNYQGNWRDIFQNWEALAVSFPQFIEPIIAKFVNASTADGFNPYRITRDGIDWEKPEPNTPWGNIGYWGDHQTIYLTKFLEASLHHHPDSLGALLTADLFSYADVPYRIKPYEAVVADPHQTIAYDTDAANRTEERVKRIGSDGRLLHDADGSLSRVNLTEKLLIPVLAKLSNLVIDGGIWMNTQRPEWNDANNALVGAGLSMVTLCYLRREIALLIDLFDKHADQQAPISVEVLRWADGVHDALAAHQSLLENPTFSDTDRRAVLDALGAAFNDYRQAIYQHGPGRRTARRIGRFVALLTVANRYLDHAIAANRRADGLYHAYNLLDLSGAKQAKIGHLYEMLEGQTAVLSAGVLGSAQVIDVCEALFASAMYRADQNSFMLYPARQLPPFMVKNVVPAESVRGNPLLTRLLQIGDGSVIVRDAEGAVRFAADLRNAKVLKAALDRLAKRTDMADLIAAHRAPTLALYETVFRHRGFTGRSGGMYGYEGLGCIYWHMVAKLLLAVQENHTAAVRRGDDGAVIDKLAALYYRIRAGLGFNKTAENYGAFPTDPYSHTPAHIGAQQPGMTGQVKEEILTRFGELGVSVRDGCVHFEPRLLAVSEFLSEPLDWKFEDVSGRSKHLALPADSLAFTYCTTPIIYHLCDDAAPTKLRIYDAQSQCVEQTMLACDRGVSASLFARNGHIARIEIDLPRHLLLSPSVFSGRSVSSQQ